MKNESSRRHAGLRAGMGLGTSVVGIMVIGCLTLSGCGSSDSSSSTTTSTTSSGSSTGGSSGTGTKSASSGSSSDSKEAPDTSAADAAGAPQRKPPAGFGNAIGRVLYNGKGVPGIEVRLCQEIGFVGGCSGQTYTGKTDKNGYYVIDKVKPGDYSVAVRVFDTNSIIYPTSGIMSAAKYTVEKDQSVSVRTVNLWKTNLQVISPKNGGSVNSDKPKLTWKAYPDAANYKVEVHTKEGVGTVTTLETAETSATPEKSLLNGAYEWKVEAYNADGTKIAETPADAVFKVTGQAGSNVVELVNPKTNTTVSGAGLTLQWKPNPLATSYRVYMKGVKAKDSLLSFETVQGTSYKFATPPPPDTYYWTVDAYKGDDKLAGSPFKDGHFTVK